MSAADSRKTFARGLKSWDVEDPVNLFVHRPAGYAFARLLMPLGLSPNQITFLSMLAGLAGAACMVLGGAIWMRAAGLLLLFCAVLDSADGIVARLTGKGSRMGQVWDQSSDNVVALASIAAATYHVLAVGHGLWIVPLAIAAYVSGIAHTAFNAFYMENYLRTTRGTTKLPGAEIAETDAEIEHATARGASRLARGALRVHRWLLGSQMALMRLADPVASVEIKGVRFSSQTADVYMRHNRGLMRAWTLFGLGPHMDFLTWFAFFDRLDLYLWVRLIGLNTVLVPMVLLQRRASRSCFQELAGVPCLPAGAEIAR